jgi:hypothetical protein
MTGHLGNDHFFTKLNGLADSIAVMSQPVEGFLMLRERRKDAQVSACAKRLSVSAQDNYRDLGNISDLPKGIEQFGGHFPVNGIVLVRPV